MNGATDLALGKDPIDEAVLLDPADAGEGVGDDAGAEMHVVVTLHLGPGTGNPGLDPRSDLVWSGHSPTG